MKDEFRVISLRAATLQNPKAIMHEATARVNRLFELPSPNAEVEPSSRLMCEKNRKNVVIRVMNRKLMRVFCILFIRVASSAVILIHPGRLGFQVLALTGLS